MHALTPSRPHVLTPFSLDEDEKLKLEAVSVRIRLGLVPRLNVCAISNARAYRKRVSMRDEDEHGEYDRHSL